MLESLPGLIRRYAVAAWRRRWIALAFSWLVCIAGWIGVTLIPNQYEASARLYVDADAVLTPLLHGLAIDSSTSNQLDTLQRTLLSGPNLEKLISKTDLDLRAPTYTARQQLVKVLGASIRVQPQTRNLFTITYRDTDPKLAYDVVRTIITIFVESATGTNRSEMENAKRFLEQQISSYENKLRQAEQRRAEFQSKYVDLLPDANGASRLEGARSVVESLQGQLQDALARQTMLMQEMASTPPMLVTGTEGGGGGGRPADLVAAERNLQQLRLRYTDQHPDVIAARNLVEALRASPSSDGTGRTAPRNLSVPNPLYEQFKVRLLDSQTAIASLQRQVKEAIRSRDRLEAIARGEPGLQAEYANMNRDYDVLRRNYQELLGRREAMRIAAAADAEADKVKLQVIDPPQVPHVPVAPKRSLLMAGVLLGGIGAGAALALLLVELDGAFYTIQDLRSFGLPVLGGISMLQPPRLARRTASTLAFGVGVLLLMAAFGGALSYPLWLTKFV